MKILFITIVLLSFPIAHSQELNEDFLKTLPKSIQKDVLDRAKQQGKNVEPKYSSVVTQTKLEKKELEDLKIRFCLLYTSPSPRD